MEYTLTSSEKLQTSGFVDAVKATFETGAMDFMIRIAVAFIPAALIMTAIVFVVIKYSASKLPQRPIWYSPVIVVSIFFLCLFLGTMVSSAFNMQKHDVYNVTYKANDQSIEKHRRTVKDYVVLDPGEKPKKTATYYDNPFN